MSFVPRIICFAIAAAMFAPVAFATLTQAAQIV
jgi:flagellar biosynthesis protein FliQ